MRTSEGRDTQRGRGVDARSPLERLRGTARLRIVVCARIPRWRPGVLGVASGGRPEALQTPLVSVYNSLDRVSSALNGRQRLEAPREPMSSLSRTAVSRFRAGLTVSCISFHPPPLAGLPFVAAMAAEQVVVRGKHSAFPERGVPVRRGDNPGDVASISWPICVAGKGPCPRASAGQDAHRRIGRATPPGSAVLPNPHGEPHPGPGSPPGSAPILPLCSQAAACPACGRGPVLCSRRTRTHARALNARERAALYWCVSRLETRSAGT